MQLVALYVRTLCLPLSTHGLDNLRTGHFRDYVDWPRRLTKNKD